VEEDRWGMEKCGVNMGMGRRGRLSTYKYLSFGAKIAKISPSDPEIIFLGVIIKKERN